MQYRILGPLEIRSNGDVVVLPGVKERAVLGLLVVELGTVVATDRIVFELWGDEPPRTAYATLRSLVSRIRRHLGRETIVTRRPGYRLGADPSAIDAVAFDALADAALRLRNDPANAARPAREALDLWRGRALADLEGFGYAETEARRLEERRLTVMEVAFGADLAMGRHGWVVADLREAIDLHPYHEPFYEQLMLALHRSGRTAEALRAFSSAERLLGEELGIEPSPALRSLERSIAIGDESLQLPAQSNPNNLPSTLTSFIGREGELESLTDVLGDRRIITLTGPGGCGKSRLSLEVAHLVLADYEHGVWRVELAPVRDPEGVVLAIAGAFGEPVSHAASPVESMIDYLRDRQMLILLDNCEHLVEAVGLAVGAIIESCPRVSVLATSRQPLAVAGESVWLVPPLRIPEANGPAEDQDDADAVRLFVSRARDASSDFSIGPRNRPWIIDICRAVDGLPLALELAAARIRNFSAQQLAQKLSSGLGALSADNVADTRHRTMRAALDWSHRLLDDRSAETFAYLAVFRGGWTLADSEAVLGPESTQSVVDLVEKSLVVRLRDQELDYRLLEPVREYAKELFENSPEHLTVSLRHATRYRDVVIESDGALRGPQQQGWMRLVEAEHDNIRKAIRFSLDAGHPQLALELVAGAGWFWFMGGHWKESYGWLCEALDAAGDSVRAERAAAIYHTAAIQVIRVNHEAVLPLIREALEVSQDIGDRYGEAWCRHLIGHAAAYSSGAGSLESLRRSRDLFDELGCEWEVAWSDRFIGAELCEIGDGAQGGELLLRSASTFREMGDLWQTAYSLFIIGATFLALPDWGPAAARPYLQRCQRLAEEIGDRVWSAHAISRLAVAAALGGFADPEPLFLDAMERHRLIGDDACLGTCLGHLGRIREDDDDPSGAARFYGEALRTAERIHRRPTVALNLCRLARLALARGDATIAHRLLASVAAIRYDAEMHMVPASVSEIDAALELGGRPSASKEAIEDLLPLALELAESIAAEGGAVLAPPARGG